MTRFVFLLAGVLLILFSGLALGTRLIGQRSTLPPTHLDPGDCELPCWQGIQPGINTREQFAKRTREIGVFGFASDYGDGITASFEIRPDEGTLTLADVWHEFGPPERIGYVGQVQLSLSGPGTTVLAELYYFDGLIQVSAVDPQNRLRLSPDMLISAIRYFSPGDPVYEIGETRAWHGFAKLQLYR